MLGQSRKCGHPSGCQEHPILSRVESLSAAEVGDPALVTSLAAVISTDPAERNPARSDERGRVSRDWNPFKCSTVIVTRPEFPSREAMQSPAFEESAISSHEAPTSSPGASACSLSGMELVVENDLNFCRRRAVDFARRAVYSRDQKTRRALATMAQGWAELARAVGSIDPISAEFRLAAEIS